MRVNRVYKCIAEVAVVDIVNHAGEEKQCTAVARVAGEWKHKLLRKVQLKHKLLKEKLLKSTKS